MWDDLSTGRMENLRGCIGRPGFRYIVSDFIHDPTFEQVVRDVDVVYHLAAAVGVQLILKNPIKSLETNILGTEVALGVAAKYGKRIFIASTSEVYGKGNDVPFREDGDLHYGPTSSLRWNYGMSKAVDEFLMLAYVRSHLLQGVAGRFFNTVGPRQVPFYGMVLPRFIEQARKNEPITVYGDGSQIRCFGHVLDLVPAVHKLMHTPAAQGEIVNLGSDEETTILALAERVKARIKSRSEIVLVPFPAGIRGGIRGYAATRAVAGAREGAHRFPRHSPSRRHHRRRSSRLSRRRRFHAVFSLQLIAPHRDRSVT